MTYAVIGVLVVVAALVAAQVLRRGSAHTVAEAGGSTVAAMHGELGQFVAMLHTVNSETDPGYVSALARMRANVPAVMAEASRIVSTAPVFAVRHSVVLAVSALQHAGAVDFLSQVALNPQPLPPKAGTRLAGDDRELAIEAAVQGTMVALDAVDGLERLADAGQAAATEALVRAAAVDSLAIRAAALTAMAARPERREPLARAVAALPGELRHLTTLTRPSVRDVPQVADPRAHLVAADGGTPSPPALTGGAPGQGGGIGAGAHGAPRIRRS